MAHLILLFISSANATTMLLGTWQYEGYRYRGVERPRTNEALVLTYDFNSSGEATLFWSYKDEPGFCQHVGHYLASQTEVEETADWLNPNNAGNCADDPDMQLGVIKKFAYALTNGRLEITARLGEENIIYLWKKIR